MGNEVKIVFLHHSTGRCIWEGGVPAWLDEYNNRNQARYSMSEIEFPQRKPYGWSNYPYDYWNIWVKNAGYTPYQNEPTLEILTKKHDVIIFKHCFPVSNITSNFGLGSLKPNHKTLNNYKNHYWVLKQKLQQFSNTKFILWTGAALVKNKTDEKSAKRAKEFFDWVRNDWDEKGDNIFLWDFYQLQTEGELYFKDEYAVSPGDSHPNAAFAKRVAPLFCQRVIDVIQERGDQGSITGAP